MIMKVPEYMAAGGSQINNYLLQFFLRLDGASNVDKFYYFLSISETDLMRSKKYSQHSNKVF